MIRGHLGGCPYLVYCRVLAKAAEPLLVPRGDVYNEAFLEARTYRHASGIALVASDETQRRFGGNDGGKLESFKTRSSSVKIATAIRGLIRSGNRRLEAPDLNPRAT